MARIDIKAVGGLPPIWSRPDFEIRIVKCSETREHFKMGGACCLCLLFAEHLPPLSNEFLQPRPDLVVEARADTLDLVAEAVYALALPEPLWIGAAWADFIDAAAGAKARSECAKAFVFKGAFDCNVADAVSVILKGAERQGFAGRISLVHLCKEDFDLQAFDAFLTRAFDSARSRVAVATATNAKSAMCTVLFVMKEIDHGEPLAGDDQ